MGECPSCKKDLPFASEGPGAWLGQHVCPHCGAPQPLSGDADYFEAFGATARFKQDRAALEKRFYEASRALHPDRFSTASPEARAASLERMSFLNEAWRTLKDPALLRPYFLDRLAPPVTPGGSAPPSSRAQIPAELAESWFELQETLMEDPVEGAKRLAEFEKEISTLKASLDEKTRGWEAEIDQALDEQDAVPEEAIEGLRHADRTRGYLASLERDIARIARK